jgi:hypothetical protein
MTAIFRMNENRPLARSLTIAAVLLAAGLGTGCSSTSSLFGSSSDSSAQASAGDPVTAFVFGPPARPGEGELPKQDVDCPSIDIRQGASTMTVAPPTRDPNAAGIKYQVSIARTARECAISGGTMTVKVGVQGRVVLGPAGGPGQLDVPIRYAVVQEGVEPRTIESKLHRHSVRIEPGQVNVPFTYVAEDLSFPLPGANALSAYVIYIGFDPNAPQERKSRQQQRRQR